MSGIDPATITAIASVAGPVLGQMNKSGGGASAPLGGVPPVTAVPPPGPGGTPPFTQAPRLPRRPGLSSPDSFEELLQELLRQRGGFGGASNFGGSM